MKTKTASTAKTVRSNLRLRILSAVCLGVVLSIAIASAIFTVSSASSRDFTADGSHSAKSDSIRKTRIVTATPSKSLAAKWFSPLAPLPLVADDAVGTYEVNAGQCTNTPKTTFALGEDVCVKASAPLAARVLTVAGTDGTVAQLVDVTTDPQELIYTLPSTTNSVVNGLVVDNRGLWRATVHTTYDFGARADAFFSVTDPDNAAADLVISNSSTAEDSVTPGSSTGFLIYLRNDGPDAAAAVHVTQNVPANMSFDSVTAGGGAAFTCAESSGVVDCTPTGAFASGATSSFTLNYTVSAGASNTILTSEVDVVSTTTDPHQDTNSATAKLEIRATGSSAPTCVLSCPLNMTVSANTTQGGEPGAIVSFGADTSGDCGTSTSSPASGSFFSVAGSPHVVTINSGTGGGSCSFTITVTETAAPTISCSADQTATTSGASNEATVTVNPPTATGANVQVTGVRSDNRSLSDDYPVGTTTITWTATECNNSPDCDDPNARFAKCTQRIIVTSADAPTISCPINKTFTGDCSGKTLTSGDIGTPTATGSNVTVAGERSDNLDLYSDPYPVGNTVITWTATDDGGRQVSCSQLITISSSGSDTTPPTLTAPPNVSVSTSSCGQIVGETELGTPDVSDNCGTPNVARTGVPAGNFFPTGTTTITYTATDGAGNTTVRTQTVTVTESVNPTITAPNDLTINTGPGATSCGVVVGDATLGTASANDNCPGVTVARTGVPSGNNFPVGTTTVTYTATDRSGNTAVDTQTVTVVDNTAPTISAPANVTLLTGAGATSCGVTVADLDTTIGTATTSDNCPGAITVARSGVPSGNTFPLGDTFVSYTATDANGNVSSTVTQKVTVVDNTPPVVTPPANITVNLPLNSTATSMAVTYPNPATATDNCAGTITFVYSPASGSTFSVGTTTVTVTATDAHNNSATATFTVTVLYNFTGFFQPVDNLPVLNVVNAGRAIPVKFSLSGNKGLNIFAANSPYTVSISCDGSAPQSDVEETVNAGGSSLGYSPDTYNYVWKTESSWAGTCRQLVVTLNDGSEHKANFKFK
jgi:hypothetical protein